MRTSAADNSEPGGLASMLDVACDIGPAWTEQELGAVLRHQLAAPLTLDLGTAASGLPCEGIETFGQLLHHPSPPLDLLVSAKDFAKAMRNDPGGALPKEVAAVMYFAAILVAERRCGRRISRL